MKNLLFLCVANSARSQLAEGLARKMFGANVLVQSAGSRPGRVNPYAVKALEEVDIDASSHRSKAISEIDLSKVDMIITLCEEEVCPQVDGNVERLHWPMPDPAAASGSDEMVMSMFRAVRKSIQEKLAALAKERHLA